jgi:ABC-type transport system involved in multi-copper enzyme maturation permease subunit
MKAIYAIASTTVGEAIRRKVLLVILLIGVLIVAIAPGLSVLSARQELTVLKSLTLGIIQMTSATIAIVLTVYLIPNEIERRTIYTILSKPVQRWQFLVGKYMGAVAALGLMMGLMTVTLLVVFFIMQRDQATMTTMLELAKVPMMYFIQMSLLAAVAVFFSTFVSPIVNFFMAGGTFVVGMMFSSVLETIKTNSELPQALKALATLIHSIIPNFQMFNVQNPVINSTSQIKGETLQYVNLGLYAVFYIAVLLIGGILIFDRKEV